MKHKILMVTLVFGFGVLQAAPVGAATPLKQRIQRVAKRLTRAKGAVALAALLAVPAQGIATPATFAKQAQQLHPIAATVARQVAVHLETLKQNGWQVSYHGNKEMHALAAQAPQNASVTKSAAVTHAVSELQKLAGVPAKKGLAQVAAHFTTDGKIVSLNASNQRLEPMQPVDGQVHWRFMMPKGQGVYDILGTTDAQSGVRAGSAWQAQLSPWGIFATPAPMPTDLSSLMAP